MNLKRNARRVATLGVGMAIVFGAGAGVSYADTSGAGGIGSGNQISVPVNLPINACGISLAIIGGALSGCQGGASAPPAHSGQSGSHTSGHGSVLGGNQVDVPVTAPVNACGNSGGVLGIGASSCTGGASVSQPGGNCCGRSGTAADGRDVKAPQRATAPVLGDLTGSDLDLGLLDSLTQTEGGLVSGLPGLGS